ncbi:MAG: hypothetical protein IKC06_04680 [Clostridia bacterium]|nr:hypothetical protein [Clostridia bacterium]MBR6742373.1 hypothetical protein [Clostridia bacterium]
MKKIILILTVCLVLPLTFLSCGSNKETSVSQGNDTQNVNTTEPQLQFVEDEEEIPCCIDERLIGYWEQGHTQVMYEEAGVPGYATAMTKQQIFMFFENGKYLAATTYASPGYAYEDQRVGEWYTDNNGLLVLENYSFSYGTGSPNVLKYSFIDDNTLVINSFDGSYSLIRSSEPFSKIPH